MRVTTRIQVVEADSGRACGRRTLSGQMSVLLMHIGVACQTTAHPFDWREDSEPRSWGLPRVREQ
jgi:hypothetical protein